MKEEPAMVMSKCGQNVNRFNTVTSEMANRSLAMNETVKSLNTNPNQIHLFNKPSSVPHINMGNLSGEVSLQNSVHTE